MSKDEFVELHGEEAWDRLVGWRQDAYNQDTENCTECYGPPCNPNVIADHKIIAPVLQLLGLRSRTIKDARYEIEHAGFPER